MRRAASLIIIDQSPHYFVSMLEPPLVLYLIFMSTVELLSLLTPSQDLSAFTCQLHFERVSLLSDVSHLLEPLFLCKIIWYVF